MDYIAEQNYLRGSRKAGAIACAGMLLCSLPLLLTQAQGRERWISILILAATLVFLYYTPDYLHLTAVPERRTRWIVKVRWRLIAAVLIVGLGAAWGDRRAIFALTGAAGLLVAFNLIGRRLPRRAVPAFCWYTDLALIFFSGQIFKLDFSVTVFILALAAHLGVVIADYERADSPGGPKEFGRKAGRIGGLSAIMVLVSQEVHHMGALALWEGFVLLVWTTIATWLLVRRAGEHNLNNIAESLQEVMEFTGYPEQQVRGLWATSNQQLAENWKKSPPPEDDPEKLKEWYRQNSELYLFALSAYNLEYKRIRSNLNVLRLGRGACMDYGAGNGEVLLELAKRGHRVTYFDVEGTSMRFAQWRAQRRGLAMEFFSSKDDLARSGRKHDTIFSLDVLEHLPDLEGELSFLASLLNPGGLLVFDVPAGATRAHPMHLNHALDPVEYLRKRDLKDERRWWQRLPWRREEKYFFRRVSA